MHLRSKLGLLAAGACLLTASLTPVYAQTPSTGIPPLPTPGDVTAPDTLLESRRAGNEARGQALGRAGRGNNLTGLRAVIRAALRPRAQNIRITGATPAVLADLDTDAMAQFLTSLGYGVSDLRPGQPETQAFIDSADKVLFGVSELADEVRVTPQVVVAEFVSYANDTVPSDGLRSTVTFRIIDPIKGGGAAGQELKLRQRSGAEGAGAVVFSTDFDADSSGRYVLFHSPSSYEARISATGAGRSAAAASPYTVGVLLPYKVEGDRIEPTALGQGAATTLAAVTAAAR